MIERELNQVHRATYDRIFRRYAVANAEMPPAVMRAAEQLLTALGPSARLLELGCGHGRDAAYFEGHGVHVTAADLSAGMLLETKARIDGPVVQLDMRRLPLPHGVFDGVWSNAAMLHLPKAALPGALREVKRVLRPGGTLYVAIQVGGDEVWEPESYGQPARRFVARYTVEEFGDLVSGAGLALLATEETNGETRRHWVHYFARRV